MLTKDRIGGALAIVAGIVGLVLVLSTHQPEGDADDDARPGTSEVQQAPGQDDDDQAPAPGQPAPGQPAQPAPAQPAPPPAGDADGDDDG